MEQHTPLEWQTDNRPSTMGMIIYGDCNTDNMHAIAVVHPKPGLMHVKDARYIVKACNAYPTLTETLERIENDCHKAANGGLTTASSKVTVKELTALLRDMRNYTRAALALAKGEQ